MAYSGQLDALEGMECKEWVRTARGPGAVLQQRPAKPSADGVRAMAWPSSVRRLIVLVTNSLAGLTQQPWLARSTGGAAGFMAEFSTAFLYGPCAARARLQAPVHALFPSQFRPQAADMACGLVRVYITLGTMNPAHADSTLRCAQENACRTQQRDPEADCLRPVDAATDHIRAYELVIAAQALYNDLIAHAIRVLDEHRDATSFWYIVKCNESVARRAAQDSDLDLEALKSRRPFHARSHLFQRSALFQGLSSLLGL